MGMQPGQGQQGGGTPVGGGGIRPDPRGAAAFARFLGGGVPVAQSPAPVKSGAFFQGLRPAPATTPQTPAAPGGAGSAYDKLAKSASPYG